jgi:protein-S-isoprenylcysteine O-methyltransferase Ste14
MKVEPTDDSYNKAKPPIYRKRVEVETINTNKLSSEARREIIIGGAFVLLGTTTLFVLVPRSIKVPENIHNIALSPAMWPKAISIFIILLGTFVLANSFIELWRQHKKSSKISLNIFKINKHFSWRGSLAVAMLLPYYFTTNHFGMLLSSVLAIFIYMLIAGEKNIIALILMSLAFPTLLTLFFIHAAGVTIPLGPLELLIRG